MDIAKIRKKALSKKMEEKATDSPVPEELTRSGEQKKESPEKGDPLPVIKSPGAGSAGTETGCAEPAFRTETPDEADDNGDQQPEEMVELLTFSISNEEYAFRVPEIEEVLRFQRITAVPTAPEYVLGITSLRGKIIPVIDLQKRLKIETAAGESHKPAESGDGKTKGLEKKIIIIDGPKGLIGALIDQVMGVVRLSRSEMLPAPGHLDEAGQTFIENIIVLSKRFISVVHSNAAMDIEAG
jgi:purine-binding chemotaxis protein CheW